jgi:lipopolysaccharide transport system ATP-binding protein
MNKVVIQTEGLGKRYRRPPAKGKGAHAETLRDLIAQAMHSPLGMLRRARQETFWALKDVSLEVREGEVLGLIGRNGAGKTTLLKILSRITRPTEGWAEIRGRVRSLLEVGTGFHPELTGRENMYLSGSILGMSRREIDRKFDEIVAFGEIEKFIETPVKHYSSGMYVRLAFAVAAHLEPEILLVDEVLAVGDLNFQKKCLGKMGEVARKGRTIVLVSHQMNQMRRLCHRVGWIDGGIVRQQGSADEVVNAYEAAMSKNGGPPAGLRTGDHARGYFTGWEIVGQEDTSPHSLSAAGPVTVRFMLKLLEPIKNGIHGVALFDGERRLLWGWAAYELNLDTGTHEFIYDFPLLPLKPGIFTWNVSFWARDELIDLGDLAPEFQVVIPSFQHQFDEWTGLLNLPSVFKVRSTSGAHSSQLSEKRK